MDRLVCGDVGFGKTEVALRAAVKAAADGKQVIVLVPTTILAQQHFGTFRERLADLPFRVEGVSRLRPAAEVKAVLKDFEAGKVDVLIGTHRLLSRDVRAKELGLVVVDEEQRFGVKQKELLRQLKLKVDVLALSATPIPRTLQMSLAGLRDISVIETPPEGRRPVRTYVGPYDEDLVRKAITREVERKGQAFVLHNRIDSLPETAERLRGLVPGARFLEAHGQMDEHTLEETMLSFLRGDADCLVTTTIIESGLDIPTANTLIVERADQLGLSQAYQIRGRVGRSRERAFAYLLYPSAEALTEEAAARLSTLADHTELGSGFRIAMRDLDIRGAGNLLGDEQSGHVAAVGFELYCQMIDEAVAEAESGVEEGEQREEAPEPVRLDVPVDAYLPATFVPFEAAKIDVHRRIVAAREPGQLRAIRDELSDRFGQLPDPAENLLKLQQARIELGLAGARSVEFRGGRLSVTGVELDSEGAGVLAEQVEGALYEWREQTAAVRVAGDPEERLAAVLAMASWPARGAPRRRDRRGLSVGVTAPPHSLRLSLGNLTMLPASWERNRGRAGSRVGSASRWSSSARSSWSSSPATRSPRGSATRASPPATSRSSPARSRRHRLGQRSGLQTGAAAAGSAGETQRHAETGRRQIRRTEDGGAGRTPRHDLDPGRGRRTRHLGDAETDRHRTGPDQKNELQNRGRIPEIPQDLALHQSGRPGPGEAAAAQHPNPGSGRERSAAGLERRNLRLLRTPPRTPSTRPPESRDVRVVVNKDKAKAEAAKALLEKDDSPASWKKVAAKYSEDPTTKTKGGLQPGADRRTSGQPGRTQSGDLRQPDRGRSSARSTSKANSSSSRSRN